MMWDDTPMTSVQPHRPSPWAGWRAIVRRRAWLLFAIGALAGVLAVLVATGWAGWLVEHPGQAWQWVVRHWFVPSALGVFVALLTAWVTWAGPRSQQRRAERLATAERAWQQQRDQDRLARQREEAAAAEQEAWARRCRELLVVWPLRAIEEVDPYHVGVFYSRRADAYSQGRSRPPYVPRAMDEELARLLHTQPLVLVKGQSRAGKSRTAFEVAARELAGWRLLVPKDREALAEFGRLEPLPGAGEQVLVWLDDLDDYLASEGARGLDAGLLDRLAACDPPAKAVATIRLEEHARLAAAPGGLGRTVRELLNRFDPGAVTMPVGFEEPAERAAIAELYPDERVIGGLAEHLAAVHELVDRLEAGEATVPEGAGLVLAAVDWRRGGLGRPVSRAEMAALLPLYLARLRPLAPVIDEGDVDRGLGWATEPVGRTAALLVPAPDPLAGTFRVADPIVDYVERRTNRRLVDPVVWQHLLARASPEEALEVGFAAYTRGERRAAEMAWRQVTDFGRPDTDIASISAAALNLGMLLAEQGDAAGARAALQQAIDSVSEIEHAPEEDLVGAWVAGVHVGLQWAINSGHPNEAPRAAFELGVLLASRGDVAGARAALQWVIDSGHPDNAPWAAFHLGVLLEEQGDAAGARAAYQQAIDSGHPDAARRAREALHTLGEHDRQA
jgi:tetratricopeptide (TPR) repeat protein